MHSLSLLQCLGVIKKRVVITLFQSFAMLRRDKIIWTSFEALSLSSPDELQLLVTLLLTNLLLMTSSLQEHLYFRCTFLQMLQASFLLIPLLYFVLPEPYKDIKFCLWSCTLEQILAYPIGPSYITCPSDRSTRSSNSSNVSGAGWRSAMSTVDSPGYFVTNYFVWTYIKTKYLQNVIRVHTVLFTPNKHAQKHVLNLKFSWDCSTYSKLIRCTQSYIIHLIINSF